MSCIRLENILANIVSNFRNAYQCIFAIIILNRSMNEMDYRENTYERQNNWNAWFFNCRKKLKEFNVI